MEPEPIKQTLANMTLSADNRLIPIKPDPIPCGGGCGKLHEPTFHEYPSIEDVNKNRFMTPAEKEERRKFSGRWRANYGPCDECAEKSRKAEDERQKREQIERLFKYSCMTAMQRTMTLDKFKPKNAGQVNALKTMREYDHEAKPNLFIHGPVGTGKTHLIAGFANKLINARKERIAVFSAVNLLYKIRATFEPDSQVETDRLVYYLSWANHLIIDDIGVEKSTDWVKEIFYLIIDNRYNSLLPTHVTSNLNPKDLAAKLDDRLVSRLLQDAIILKLDGQDHRLSREKP